MAHTRRRMLRELGNIDRDDDPGTQLAAKLVTCSDGGCKRKSSRQRGSQSLCQRDSVAKRLVLWGLARRLAPEFANASARMLRSFDGTIRNFDSNARCLEMAALKAFAERQPILGVPGVNRRQINASGPNGSLHSRQRGEEQFLDLFRRHALRPVRELLLHLPTLSRLFCGRRRSLAELLRILRGIPGWRGPLKSGDLTQDLIGQHGVLKFKPSKAYRDLATAGYAGPGAAYACNWIFRGSRSAAFAPAGRLGRQGCLSQAATERLREKQVVKELKSLVVAWEQVSGGRQLRLGAKQRKMHVLMAEFVACDFQRAVK